MPGTQQPIFDLQVQTICSLLKPGRIGRLPKGNARAQLLPSKLRQAISLLKVTLAEVDS